MRHWCALLRYIACSPVWTSTQAPAFVEGEMVAASVASHLCRPLSLQLSAPATCSALRSCSQHAGVQTSSCPLRYLDFSSSLPAFRGSFAVACSSKERPARGLSNPFSRRPLLRGFLKGLAGFVVFEGASAMSSGTPPASARAKASEIEKVTIPGVSFGGRELDSLIR